jgi:anti-sigma factor RsiW
LWQKLHDQFGSAPASSGKANTGRAIPWQFIAVAASVAMISAVAVLLVRGARNGQTDQMAHEVLDSHIRSLMGDHLFDVHSSDQHTVKPWFAGRLDFSPAVIDLAAAGFPLVGGRLEYLDGRPVAALVYKRRQHTINVFTWPSPRQEESSQHFHIRGFNAIRWVHRNMTYWAVSDLNDKELQDFATALDR